MAVDFKKIVKESIVAYQKPELEDLGKSPFAFEEAAFQKALSLVNTKFPVIDLSFLKKVKNKKPVFSVFTVDNSTCFFKVKIEFNKDKNEVVIDSNVVSKVVLEQFKETFYNLARMCTKLYFDNYGYSRTATAECTLVSNFQGLIPETARAKIKQNLNQFDEIVIVAEADNWKCLNEITKMPPNPDPLIIGIKADTAFLIDSFDVTKLENYIKKEFTS